MLYDSIVKQLSSFGENKWYTDENEPANNFEWLKPSYWMPIKLSELTNSTNKRNTNKRNTKLVANSFQIKKSSSYESVIEFIT